MNMKKVLAAVLAVMLAISAMAITAFAEEYVITLSADKTTSNGAAYSTVEFTVPVYAKWGYATEDLTLTFTLPTDNDATYAVVAGGETYLLGSANNDGVYVVNFGTQTHSWDGKTTVIPQSAVSGDNKTLTLVGTFKVIKNANGSEASRIGAKDFTTIAYYGFNNYYSGGNYASNYTWTASDPDQAAKYNQYLTELEAYNVYVENKEAWDAWTAYEQYAKDLAAYQEYMEKVADGETPDEVKEPAKVAYPTVEKPETEPVKVEKPAEVANSVYYVSAITPNTVYSCVSNDAINSNSYVQDWNAKDGADIAANDSYRSAALTNLYWNATLQNKAAILGAETAKVVVTYDKTFVGNYYFGLVAKYADGSTYELTNNFNNWYGNEKYAAYVEITAATDTVEFDLPVEALYSTTYGIFNEYMDVVVIDAAHKANLDTIATLKATAKANGVKTGTFGNYSWDADNVYFAGEAINQYWNQLTAATGSSNFPVPTSVKIVLNADDAENVDIDTPVESTEEEVDTDDTDATVDVEDKTEDTNPTTGIALAVVPMMVAAAAVVASKRR